MEMRYKVMTNIFDFRLKMVRSAQQYGISETARLFKVSRPTVYKWLRRFEQEQVAGLADRSRRLFAHLQNLGMDLSQVVVQTDNGTEFVCNSPDLTRRSAFKEAVESAQARLKRIPPRACTWQSEVERSNGIIEYELLEVDRWQSKSELVGKSTAWEYYFNRLRPNSYQQNRTPDQRMKRAGIPSKTAERACLWSVPILDGPQFKHLNFGAP